MEEESGLASIEEGIGRNVCILGLKGGLGDWVLCFASACLDMFCCSDGLLRGVLVWQSNGQSWMLRSIGQLILVL